MKFKLTELIDGETGRRLLNNFHDAIGIGAVVADLDGNALFVSKTQRICSGFHSIRKRICIECTKSGTAPVSGVPVKNGLTLYRCANGLTSAASPITINGEHVGSIFVGHFFFVAPDKSAFRREAVRHGFDKSDYLAALSQVPIVVEERLPSIVSLLTCLIEIPVSTGLRPPGHTAIEQELRESLDRMMHRVEGLTAELETVKRGLQFGEEYFRRTFDDGPISAAIVSTDLSYQRVNAAFCRLIGYPTEELLKLKFPEITHPDDVEINLANARNLLSGEADQYDVEKRYIRKDGETVWANLHVRIIRDGSGKPLYFVCMMEDITERKRAEEAIQRDIARRKEAEEELKLYMKELERSNRALREFTSVASHDLQEPLRKIRLFGEMVKKTLDRLMTPEAMDYLNKIQDASERMQALIESLLAYSRLTTRTEAFSSVDLRKTVQGVLSDLEARIAKEKGSVSVGNLPLIEADPNQMRQLLQNLISNALKYHGQTNPQVQVHSEILGNGTCKIYVQDNGIGFDEEDLDKIFAPFQRLHRRKEYEGTGMGLAICRKIVERHGGSITAKSKVGEGSTFIVTLPVRQILNRPKTAQNS